MPSSTSTWDRSPCPFHLSTILGVAPDIENQCVGFATTKNRRCGLPVSIRSRGQASRILDEGSRLLQSGEENIDEILGQLAPLLLCRREHQDQAAQLVCEWSREVEKFHERRFASTGFLLRSPSPSLTLRHESDSERARLYRALASTADRGSPSSRTTIDAIAPDDRSRSIRRSSSPPRFNNTEQADAPSNTTPATATAIAAMMDQPRIYTPTTPVISAASLTSFENNLQAHYARLAQQRHTLEPERHRLYAYPSSLTGTNHVSHGFSSRYSGREPRTFVFESGNRRSVPQTTFSTTSRIIISGSNGGHPTTTSSTRSAQTSSEAETNTPTSRESANQAQNPDRQLASRSEEVIRRHVEGQCSICFLPLLEDESDAEGYEAEESDDSTELHAHPRIVHDELVWCRRRCGNNFHRDCMDSWIRTFRDGFERNGRQPTCPICRTEWEDGQ